MTVPSTLESVVVHRAGATVTRRVEWGSTGGAPREVRVAGLPLCLDDASVRAVVASTEGGPVEVLSVVVGLHVEPRTGVIDEPDLLALRAVERRIEEARLTLGRVEVELDLLGQVGIPARPTPEEGTQPPASPMSARVALEGFVDETRGARLAEKRRVEAQLRELEREAAAQRETIARASTARRARRDEVTKVVTLRFTEASTGERAVIRLSYGVPGARWAPAYRLNLKGGTRAELQLRAVVAQNTGEDWTHVAISLSTAAPGAFIEIPELKALRYGKAQPEPPKRAFAPPPMGALALFADWDRDRQGLPTPHAPGAPARIPTIEAAQPLMPANLDHLERGGGGRHDAVGYAGAPPAEAEMAYPAPPPPPAPAPGAGGPMGRMAAMAPPAPQARAMAKSAPKRSRREAEESFSADDEADEPSPMEPEGPSIPAFASLTLPPATSGSRGRLQASDRRVRLAQGLAASGLSFDFDVVGLVDERVAAAQAVAGVAWPSGIRPPQAYVAEFNYKYLADLPVSVPSDGRFHTIPLGVREFEAEVLYVVVPREDPSVYRQASMVNPERAPLLPGPVEIVVDGQYVVTAELPAVGPLGRFKLGLGVDPAVKCARNTRFEEKRAGQGVVATTELHHAVDLEVANRTGRDIRVEVRERIPVPAPDAEVVVEEGPVEPPWEKWDQAERGAKVEGGRRWQLAIPKAGAVKLSARYIVKIYANNEVVGGNRREA